MEKHIGNLAYLAVALSISRVPIPTISCWYGTGTRVTLAFPIPSGLLHKVPVLTSIAAPMALAAPTSASLSLSFLDFRAFRSATAKAPAATPRLRLRKCSSTRSSFATGSPL
ncbi:hypothetical protein I3843_05G010300 [Carya illinoinensis]|nr:hypothetical protein I3843_05G010300 [Carya illinoinensis]